MCGIGSCRPVQSTRVMVLLYLYDLHLDSILIKRGEQNLNLRVRRRLSDLCHGFSNLANWTSMPISAILSYCQESWGNIIFFHFPGLLSAPWQSYQKLFDFSLPSLRLVTLSVFFKTKLLIGCQSCSNIFGHLDHPALPPMPDLFLSCIEPGLMHEWELPLCLWRAVQLLKVVIGVI